MDEFNKKESLLTKLRNSLAVRLANSKICRKLPALILAGSMLVQLTACTLDNDVTDTTTGGPTYVTTAPLIPGTTPATPVVPGTTTAPITTPSTPPVTTVPEKQMSEMLQTALNDPYYATIAARGKNYPALLDTGLFDPHPYGFLEDEGYDIEAIKNNELECRTSSFILDEEPNSLYILTAVETKAEKAWESYFTEYMLRYDITDLERKDIKKIHDLDFFESVFLNDIISQTREPEIITEVTCLKDVHNTIEHVATLNEKAKNFLGIHISNSYLKSFDIENGTFEVYILSSDGGGNHSSHRPVAVLNFNEAYEGGITADSNNTLTKPWSVTQFEVSDNSSTDSIKSATVFHTQKLSPDWAKWFTASIYENSN